jgi:cleavage and polyadenylation specificity factor subunit 1
MLCKQEDPFKLIVLSKDMSPLRLFSAEFFFAENELLFLSADLEGVLRLHSYDPSRTAKTWFYYTGEARC